MKHLRLYEDGFGYNEYEYLYYTTPNIDGIMRVEKIRDGSRGIFVNRVKILNLRKYAFLKFENVDGRITEEDDLDKNEYDDILNDITSDGWFRDATEEEIEQFKFVDESTNKYNI